MTIERSVAISATIAVLSSMAAATGFADELADLRANQVLLQRRLDQLAQMPGAGGLYLNFPDPRGTASEGGGVGGGSFRRSFLIPETDTSLRISGQISEFLTYFVTGGRPNIIGGTANTGGAYGGAVVSVPLHVHNGPPAAGVFSLAGNPTRSLGHSVLYQTPYASRIQVQTRTPTAWGEARAYASFDFAGNNQFVPGNNALLSTNSLAPRLLTAYATLGELLGGQAYSNFYDPDASAESVNFGGIVGDPGPSRLPQVRYSLPLAAWGVAGTLSIAAEAPETDGVTAAGFIASDATSQNPTFTCSALVIGASGTTTCTPLVSVVNPFKTPAPDFTAAWYIPQPWGHMDFSAVVRPTLQIKDGAFVNRTFTGYGIHFGGDVKPGWFGWDRDYITWHFTWGDGIGRYIGGPPALLSNYPVAAPGTSAAAANVAAKTVVAWGGNAGYQHRWSATVRSNINAGILHADVGNVGNAAGGFICSAFSAAAMAGSGNCGLNKELITTSLNVIWNPVPFAEVGLEYMWGHRMVLSHLKGDENVLISAFRVNF